MQWKGYLVLISFYFKHWCMVLIWFSHVILTGLSISDTFACPIIVYQDSSKIHQMKSVFCQCGQLNRVPLPLTNTPCRIPASSITEFSFDRSIDIRPQKTMDSSNEHFWLHDLDPWPMTLTYQLDLDIRQLGTHAKFKFVCLSVQPGEWDGRTDTQTYRHRHRHR